MPAWATSSSCGRRWHDAPPTKYSGKSATVVRFSRSRGRYERQGILVETPAIEKAEAECTSDADDRAKARARAAKLRVGQDQELVQQMTGRISRPFPALHPARGTCHRRPHRYARQRAGWS
jgi:hypothetical protein